MIGIACIRIQHILNNSVCQQEIHAGIENNEPIDIFNRGITFGDTAFLS
jgi:hypothetical protein